MSDIITKSTKTIGEIVRKEIEKCGVYDLETVQEVHDLIWTKEVQDPNSPFRRKPIHRENERSRIFPLFWWLEYCTNRRLGEFLMDITEMVMLQHYVFGHGETDLTDTMEDSRSRVESRFRLFTEVSEIVSFEELKEMGFWTGLESE